MLKSSVANPSWRNPFFLSELRPNYAINPTPELDLRSNRAVQPARVIAALGVQGGFVAYMRGEPYVWSDGEFLHLWSKSGNDGWADMAEYADSKSASGVALSETRVDEFVVMRFAELMKAGLLDATVERALKSWGENFGAKALVELKHEILKR